MEFLGFRYFVLVALHGGFTQAARAAGVSQPSITKQIRRLEEGLGSQLLTRHARGVRLTPAGDILLERLKNVIEAVGAVVENDVDSEQVPDRLVFGLASEISKFVSPFVLDLVKRKWPDLTIEFREENSEILEIKTKRGHIDLSLTYDAIEDQDLCVIPIFKEPLYLISCPLLQKQGNLMPLHMRDLTGLQFVLLGQSHNIRQKIERLEYHRGKSVHKILEVGTVGLALALCSRPFGYTILPQVACYGEVTRGELVARALAEPTMSSKLCLAASRRPGVSAFVDLVVPEVRQLITGLVGSGGWPNAANLHML